MHCMLKEMKNQLAELKAEEVAMLLAKLDRPGMLSDGLSTTKGKGKKKVWFGLISLSRPW